MFQSMFFDNVAKTIRVINTRAADGVKLGPDNFADCMNSVIYHIEKLHPVETRMVDGVDTLQIYVMPLHPVQMAAYAQHYTFNADGQLCLMRSEMATLDNDGNAINAVPAEEVALSAQGESDVTPQG